MLIIKRFWKIAIVLVVSLNILHMYYSDTPKLKTAHVEQKTRYRLFSKCDCRRNDHIFVNKQIASDNSDLYEVTTTFNSSSYTVKETELDELVCGAYETLRRGRHQKVIGYSLYGKEWRYTGFLKSRKRNQALSLKIRLIVKILD